MHNFVHTEEFNAVVHGAHLHLIITYKKTFKG